MVSHEDVVLSGEPSFYSGEELRSIGVKSSPRGWVEGLVIKSVSSAVGLLGSKSDLTPLPVI